jgi:formylglycine-generating enzyme required for sulfatase activity
MNSLAAQTEAARVQTDSLFALLDPAALYDRPVAERHRLIFYRGHLEAFDWNLLGRETLGKPSFHPSFDKLFAFGIDPEPGKGPADLPGDWPSSDEVRSYAGRVRQEIDGALEQLPEELLYVAVEHRLMHAETLAYLFHNLPYPAKRGSAPGTGTRPAPANPMVEIAAGEAVLGRPRGKGFGWDNEFERHAAHVPAFRISRLKISNGEYLEYMRAVQDPAPHFWVQRDRQWYLRAMFGEIPLPLDWPVYVSHVQAAAYARWRGCSLPTEAQFHRAAEGASPVNANFERWDPVPVDQANGAGTSRPAQMIGNGWEWTSSVFGPFAGFERFPFYPGYSADFFDGKHYVLKGGSPRTADCLLRSSFRNWFRAEYPYAYTGFRIVENT